ncbi:MAG: class I mannose-6-phosphate isomerase [Bacteroidales bacterium]|nr:class I mannose-6-phosphate isomerase [Candidatus Scybalousia scybalohippi]
MEERGLYPLKFMPLFKDKIWGGNKIKDIVGIDYSPLARCGELWVLSAIEGDETVVENGFLAECTLPEVIEMYNDELLGEANFDRFSTEFPLLIKIIDAHDNLSAQVHPDDHYASHHMGQANGKTEMWYVLQADEDAKIYAGFTQKETKADVINRLRNKTFVDVMHYDKAEQGDLYFIPAGKMHAIGKGVLLAEIQQSSDATFRLYDWDRVDDNGNPRQLHLEQGLEVLDLSKQEGTAKGHYHYHLNETTNLVQCPYFVTNVMPLTKALKKDLSNADTFYLYFCVAGKGFVTSMGHRIPLSAGEIMMIPAKAEDALVEPSPMMEILEITIL